MRGQRTHSNSKNILRFQSYFSSYILTIPRTNFYEYYSSIKEASLEQKLIQDKPKKTLVFKIIVMGSIPILLVLYIFI